MILVTGATGTIGREVVEQLAAAGRQVTALVREPSRAEVIRGRGVSVAVADMSDPAAVRGVFEDAKPRRVFVLTPDGIPERKLAMEAAVIDEAASAGVERIVYLSVVELGEDPEFAFRRWHEESEQRIEATGIAWTHLRPVAFTSNLLASAESIRSEGAFYLPAGDGRHAPVDPRDVAAVAVKALTEEGHARKAYPLTGPEALTHAEQAAHLSAVLGRDVRFVDVPEQAAREAMAQTGMPEPVVEALLEFYALIRAGRRALVSAHVEQITGRPARPFAAWVQENAAAFN